jgi:hypothetical protein
MDFSLNVDSSLDYLFQAPSSSSLDFFAQHDFDLSSDPLIDPALSLTALQTIQPSQLTAMSPSSSPSPSSPSSSSATSPSYTSYEASSSGSPPPQPRTKKNKTRLSSSNDEENHDQHHAKRHQTKLACTWCRKLSKKCDAQRPCGRCRQFDRCAECVDAPPRKPRAKGIDRGTYKKTRDLAARNYPEAVSRREVYLAKQEKMGKVLSIGLTADEILEQTRKDEARIRREQPEMGDVIIQGGSPFTGPLEDLFTCSASPDLEDTLLSPTFSREPSPLFDISSPTDSTSGTDCGSPEFGSWHWETMEAFPNIMKLVAAAQAAENLNPTDVDGDELQSWTNLALVA